MDKQEASEQKKRDNKDQEVTNLNFVGKNYIGSWLVDMTLSLSSLRPRSCDNKRQRIPGKFA